MGDTAKVRRLRGEAVSGWAFGALLVWALVIYAALIGESIGGGWYVAGALLILKPLTLTKTWERWRERLRDKRDLPGPLRDATDEELRHAKSCAMKGPRQAHPAEVVFTDPDGTPFPEPDPDAPHIADLLRERFGEDESGEGSER